MRLFTLPTLLFKIFPQIYWRTIGTGNQVFLTFDDGPDAYCTPKILDILQEENAQATFFVIGEKVQRFPWILNQIHQQGHQIGIHSYNHPRLFFPSRDCLYHQISLTKFIIEAIILKTVEYFRPPYGILSPRLIKICHQLDLKVVMWNIMSYDFDISVPDQFILKQIKTKVTRGAIIVFHDGHVNSGRTIKIVAPVIKSLKERGFQFVSISQ